VLANVRLHAGNLELKFKDNDQHWLNMVRDWHRKPCWLPPKIAYVIPGCGISGGMANVLQHTNRLLRRGHDVVLYSFDGSTHIDWFPDQRVDIVPLADDPGNCDIMVATAWYTAYPVMEHPAPAARQAARRRTPHRRPVDLGSRHPPPRTPVPWARGGEARRCARFRRRGVERDAAHRDGGVDDLGASCV
jgi:hypothetical protein